MNYTECEKALIRLIMLTMVSIAVQNKYHDCIGDDYMIDDDVNLLFLLIKENEQLKKSLETKNGENT